jgi:nucleoside-diphosphate-sugar epimerase
MIINENDLILVTGSNGFIGSRVVGNLLERV